MHVVIIVLEMGPNDMLSPSIEPLSVEGMHYCQGWISACQKVTIYFFPFNIVY